MTESNLKLKRITLYKNDLGYFERFNTPDDRSATLSVAKKHKKLVIDTLCTNAEAVTFDTEEHKKYVETSKVESFYAFTDLKTSESFAEFLKSCIGSEVSIFTKGNTNQIIGRIVLIEEESVPVEKSSDTVKRNTVQILTADGFIRNFNSKFSIKCKSD